MIIDSPPMLPLADTTIWMRLADAVLLVTRPGVTSKEPASAGPGSGGAVKAFGGGPQRIHRGWLPNKYYYHYGGKSPAIPIESSAAR